MYRSQYVLITMYRLSVPFQRAMPRGINHVISVECVDCVHDLDSSTVVLYYSSV